MIENRIEVIKGDITQLAVDAIVNAANQLLMGGSGVDGAIHRVAGPKLIEECLSIGGCPTGDAVITKGYNLMAKYVIHAVGPIWRGGLQGEPEQLASCYRKSLLLASQTSDIFTIAFPAISCGVYQYPIAAAAKIAIYEVRKFLEKNTKLKKVYLICFEEECYYRYQHEIE